VPVPSRFRRSSLRRSKRALASAVNYAEVFEIEHFDTSNTDAWLQCVVVVNGIVVSTITVDVKPTGALSKGQANLGVAEAFSKIPAIYASAVSR